MYHLIPSRNGEKIRDVINDGKSRLGATAAHKAQAGMARLHHMDPIDSNQASEVGPFALQNKKLHPLK